MPLLATAATSPAQRVPCLEKERKEERRKGGKKERNTERREKKRPVNKTPQIFGRLIGCMTRRSTADRYIYFYIQSRHGRPQVVSMSAIGCERTESDETKQTHGNDRFLALIPLNKLEWNARRTHNQRERTTADYLRRLSSCNLEMPTTLEPRVDGMGGEGGRNAGGSWQTQGNCELDFVFSQRVLRWARASAVRPRSRRHDVEIQGAITKGADHRIPVRCIPKANLLGNVHTMSFKQ